MKESMEKCAHCKERILSGEDYYLVPTPEGRKTVHKKCMEKKSGQS